VRALTVDGEATAVTKTAVATEVHQALDVQLNFALEIAFDAVLGLEEIADTLDLGLREFLGLLLRRDIRALADLARERTANAVEVRERVSDLLVTGEVDACNTSHDVSSFSALALLVARVLTDDTNDAFSSNDLALIANFLDRRTDLHSVTPIGMKESSLMIYLWRYVIRPRLGSYGLTSTVTRSPGRMRM
jgi:hypothetical protein